MTALLLFLAALLAGLAVVAVILAFDLAGGPR